MNNIRVILWGFGAMGSGVAKMLLEKKGVDIVGVCDINEANVGRSMYECLGLEQGSRPDVTVQKDISKVVSTKCCDVAIVMTDSFVKNAFDKYIYCLEHQLNVVSIAEELAYPQAQNEELAVRLNKTAKDNGVSILGTGINPGFVLDYLVLALTGTCQNVESILAKRVNDLSPFGTTVMHEQGVGITKDEFDKRMAEDNLAGHVGFPESIRMVADGLGVKIDRIEQTKDPIISNTKRETPYAKVEPGNLAGVRQRGFGYCGDELFIEMDHPQQILPGTENLTTGDYITIKGTPNIDMQISPEIPGGIGTIAMCVNMIPHVINASPGLKTMLDLPVPRAIMGDMRDMLTKE